MRYLCRVCDQPSIGPPTMEEMQRICAIDSRHHRQELTPERYQSWNAHMVKTGYQSLWLVAREDGRVIAHVWIVTKGTTATVLNVMACAYATPKIQVAAMLLEAEGMLAELGVATIGYSDSEAGSDYDEVFEVCGYTKELEIAKMPKDAYVQAKTLTGERAALQWRTISHELQEERARICLDQSWSTPRLSLSASSSDS